MMASYEVRTRRFSRAEYERLIELGVFQHDLGLDSGRGEEQIDDCSTDVLPGEREPDGGQPPRGVLFDRGDDPPPASLKLAHERLGVLIIGDEHGQIGVTGQSRLGSGA